MGVYENPKEFIKKDNSRMIFLFKTNQRKRKGQLIKFCDRFLPKNTGYGYVAEGITKVYMEEQLKKLDQNKEYQIKTSSTKYEGDDIKILNQRNNWKPWQLTIYNKFFNQDLSFKKGEERKIYSLIDTEGKSGKSIFYKWLLVNVGEDKIGKITFGTASQLRTSIVSMGTKKMYILDLTRTKGKNDNEEDLMSVLESIADGMVSSMMYGKGETLLMEPPHVMITSNYLLDYELLSMDRWKVYEILPDGTLGKENEIFHHKEKRQEILEKQYEKTQERIQARTFNKLGSVVKL